MRPAAHLPAISRLSKRQARQIRAARCWAVKLKEAAVANERDGGVQLSEYLEFINRRGFLRGAALASVASFLAACAGNVPAANTQNAQSTAQPAAGNAFGRPMRAAFSNAGLGATWCAQGKDAAEQWGRWLGVEVTWFDGGLSIDKQRRAIDDMATQQWDFVAIQAFVIDTLVDPVKQMIAKGIPVIQMDTTISKDDIGITTFLEPDNVLMGATVTDALFQKMGGQGNVIMTQGALGHTGATGRADGFRQTLAKYPNITLVAEDPADWDVNKVAKLWEDYLVKYPAGQIQGAMFHNDDMALAAAKVIQNAGREGEIALAGVDAMPPAIQAVIDGSLAATVRNPSSRIHWGAVVLGGLAASGVKDLPKYVLTDGPVVTQKIAPGLLFMEQQLLA
jgi:ribose transport system substrate-binding protein